MGDSDSYPRAVDATKWGVFVSIVICIRDEEGVALEFVRRVDHYLDAHFAMHELVVVDDGSRDGTVQSVRNVMGDLKGALVLLEMAGPQGSEAGMLAGLERATGDFVFEVEAIDGLSDFEVLGEIWGTAATGFDIVAAGEGSAGVFRRVFYRLVNRFSRLDLEAKEETVRVVSRRALNAMLNLNEKTPYRKALYAATGYARAYVPLSPIRRSSRSPKPTRERLSLAMDIIISFSDLGLRVVNLLSLAFLLFSIVSGAYTIYIFAFTDGVVSGWTTTMLMLSVSFTGLFVILGLLGEYLSRILVEVRRRPLFTVRRSWVHIPVGDPAPQATRAVADEVDTEDG